MCIITILETGFLEETRFLIPLNIKRFVKFCQINLLCAIPNMGNYNKIAILKHSDRIKGEKADNLELAIASYTAALEVRIRQA